MCSAPAELDVHFVRDVSFESDVRFAREDAEHITSLCDETVAKQRRNTSLCVSTTSLWRSHNITLYKRPKVCYNAAYYHMLKKNRNTVFIHILSIKGMNNVLMNQLLKLFD